MSSPSTRPSSRNSVQRTKIQRMKHVDVTRSSVGGLPGRRFSHPKPISLARVWIEDLDKDLREGEDAAVDKICLDRFKVFLKQYNEWVEANKDRLEEESYKYDQDYYPGRRKRGKDYEEGMYELPFYYPGMICEGTVTTLHLYQGAFIDIGAFTTRLHFSFHIH